MSTPTAAWPTPALVGAASRAQWGTLDGRAHAGQRAILRALVDLLPYGSGAGRITAAQVAQAAGYSERWTRVCLAALEAAGLITWSRGWLDRGRPRAGFVRIVKTALAALVRAARGDGKADQRAAGRRDALRGRLAKLRQPTQRPRRTHRRLSDRAEVSSSLPFLKGSTTPAGSAGRGPHTRTQPNIGDTMTTPPPLAPYLCLICHETEIACKRSGAHRYLAAAEAPPCDVCHRAAPQCHAASAKVPASLRHAYAPAATTWILK